MRSAGLAVALLALASCGPAEGPAAAPPVRLVSGAGLLRTLELRAHPVSCLPPGLAEPIRAVLETEAFHVAPDAWVAGPVLPAGSALARMVDADEPVGRWRAEVPADLDLGLGGFWMTHSGRPLRRVTGGEDLWSVGHHVFSWDAGRRVLVHYGTEPPGPLAYGWRPDAELSLPDWEPALAGRPVPTSSGELVRRLHLGAQERPVLLAPAPSAFAQPVEVLHAEALEVDLAVLDMALAMRRGRLVRAPGHGDGVTFAVDVERADGTRERVWSRLVRPGGGWQRERIDLSAHRGRAFTLWLVTEPGDDTTFDLACWSGLRLRGGARHAPERPHVVLIDIDTLRADRLGCYGAERATSPQLDAWAAEHAVVYSDVVSAADWTLPATASMLTGLAVREHEVIEGSVRVTEAMQPLALRLGRAGYETWARTDGGLVTPAFGFATGFDEFETRKLGNVDDWGDPFEGLLDRLAERDAEQPVFLFVQSYRVHAPYAYDPRFLDAGRPYDGPLAGRMVTPEELVQLSQDGAGTPADWAYAGALYDAGIARFDERLGPFLRGLDEALGGQPALVVITSDHGEELGERGHGGHGHSLYDEVARVPLIVAWPGRDPVGVDPRPVTLLDLVPTLLDAVGLPAEPDLSGRSLRAPERGPRLRVAQHRDSAHAVWFDRWKWIEGRMGTRAGQRPIRALYGLRDDPGERVDASAERDDLARRLAERLEAWRAEHRPRSLVGNAAGVLDPELVEELAALGYVEIR